MHGGIRYFLDTYAIVAMLDGVKEYSEFNSKESVTTLLNLMEAQYAMYKRGMADSEIKKIISDLMPLCIGFSNDDCFESVKFKFENKKGGMSYIDCLGYTLAKKNDMLFLTGDKEFNGLPNVKFVKANE